MVMVKELTKYRAGDTCLDILSADGAGWRVSLPPTLQAYQGELEALLGKVFSQRQQPENLALAQQMSLNWCQSKCRQVGISFEETWTNN